MQRILPFIIFLLFPFFSVYGTEQPTVAVSIRPLHSLVSMVMLDVGEPKLLVSSAGSPHGYNLRPSEARNLYNSDLIVWVGPELETFLSRPLANINDKQKIMTLSLDLPDLIRLSPRNAGSWPDQDHAENDHGHHALEAASIDPHIWLDPANASIIVRALTEKLMLIDPLNASSYAKNLTNIIQQLENLDRNLQSRLKKFSGSRYVVFHDAYQYFEKHFNLNPLGALAIDPDRRPGVRRLNQIKEQIRTEGAICVFSEPQFEPALIDILIEGTSVRTGVLDPLGTNLKPGSELYFNLMEQMASAVEQCLTAEER